MSKTWVCVNCNKKFDNGMNYYGAEFCWKCYSKLLEKELEELRNLIFESLSNEEKQKILNFGYGDLLSFNVVKNVFTKQYIHQKDKGEIL